MAQGRAYEDEYAAEQFFVEFQRIARSSTTVPVPSSSSSLTIGTAVLGGKRPRPEGEGPTTDVIEGDPFDAVLSRYGLADPKQTAADRNRLSSEARALHKRRSHLSRSLVECRRQFVKLDSDAQNVKGVEMSSEMTSVGGTLVAAPKNHEVTRVFKQLQEEREAVVKRIESLQSSLKLVNGDIRRVQAREREMNAVAAAMVTLCERPPVVYGDNAADEEEDDAAVLPPIEIDTSLTATDIASAAASMDTSKTLSVQTGNPYGKVLLVMSPSQSVLRAKGPSLVDRRGGGADTTKQPSSTTKGGGADASASSGGLLLATADREALSRYHSRLETIGKLRRQPGYLAMTPLERVRAEMDALQAKRNKYHRTR